MPPDIYPVKRYIEITETVSQEKLAAARRVAGVHIHVSFPSLDCAIKYYNIFRNYFDHLCALGDHSGGERLRLYKVMAENWHTPLIKDKEHFFSLAKEQGFAEDPRKCYWLIRLSPHGTIEFRMFDIADRHKIMGYIWEIVRIMRAEIL